MWDRRCRFEFGRDLEYPTGGLGRGNYACYVIEVSEDVQPAVVAGTTWN